MAPDDRDARNHPTLTAGRHWLAKVAFESAMILVSILLAFAIDNWRETAARRRDLAEARASLAEELRFNRVLLASDLYLQHHVQLQTTYQRMLTSGSVDQAAALFQNGVHPTPLRDAGWRSFVASEVAGDLAFAQRARLAGIYGAQETLADLHRSMLPALVAPRADRDSPAFLRDMVRAINMYLTDVVATEQGIMREYEAAIQELESNLAR